MKKKEKPPTLTMPTRRLPSYVIPTSGAAGSIGLERKPNYNSLCVMELIYYVCTKELTIFPSAYGPTPKRAIVSDSGPYCITSTLSTLFININDNESMHTLLENDLQNYFKGRFKDKDSHSLLRRYLLENGHRILGTRQLPQAKLRTMITRISNKYKTKDLRLKDLKDLFTFIDNTLKKKNPKDWALRQEIISLTTTPRPPRMEAPTPVETPQQEEALISH